MIDLNLDPSQKELKWFAVLQVLFFTLIAWLWYKGSGNDFWPGVLLFVSLTVGVLGWAMPAFMKKVYVVWMIAVFPIGWTISHVLLAAIFYTIVTAIGLIMRAIGRDPLQGQFDKSASTYWQPREVPKSTSRYFRQF